MDYGSAVSQKGYDVKTCADRFLVYSSAFQTLKVFNVYSVSGSVPISGTNTISVTHNLGYYAPYIVISNGNGNNISDINPSGTRQYTNRVEIDIEEYEDGPTRYYTVYVFLDDFRTVNQQNINTSTSQIGSTSDYGIRISKDGFDVKTCDNKDCVLSSSFYNQIVHRKGIQSYTSGYTVSHNLGYVPDYLSFSKPSGASYIESNSYGFGLANINSSSLNFDSTANFERELYYIIFKNKLN